MPTSSTPTLSSSSALRQLYPPLDAYSTAFLQVSPIHRIYYEQSGNPNGKPVIALHGGPGGGSDPTMRQYTAHRHRHTSTSAPLTSSPSQLLIPPSPPLSSRRYFDPAVYRIVLADQRGAGHSTPRAELEENTTWLLVDDIERIRKELHIEQWTIVFGGSWGSTLSLAYAETHPERVQSLVLRGIFLLRHKELQWFYQEGASLMFPDYFEPYLNAIPEAERGDLISAYHRRLTGSDEAEKLKAATAWSVWELSTSRLHVDPAYIARAADDAQFAIVFARIESHYFMHRGWMEEGQLLRDAHRIAHIPGVIVSGRYEQLHQIQLPYSCGFSTPSRCHRHPSPVPPVCRHSPLSSSPRYDMVCPHYSSYDLSKVWKKGTLRTVPDAGHSAKEPGIMHELILATDSFRDL